MHAPRFQSAFRSLRPALPLLGLLVLVSGCKRVTANRAASATSAVANTQRSQAGAHAPRDSVPRPASAGAFDLVTANGGAALVWAPGAGKGLSLTLLDAQGATRRTESVFAEGEDAGLPPSSANISEVAAVARDQQLGIVWLEETAGAARSRGTLRTISDSGSAAHVIEIGPVLLPVSRPRGNLAITSTSDRFLVLSRGEKSECIDSSANDCVGFAFHRLEANGTSTQSLPLSVPLPCDQNSVSFAVAGSRWYYGVCSRATGKPVTTLFSIQTDPEYARADRILEGCLPLGALSQGGDLLVVGDCGGERRGVRVRSGNAETSEIRVNRLDAVCDAGRPLLHQLGPNGLKLSLDGPRDRVEAFLPPELAPPASRAVWTGQRLLVAHMTGPSVTLKAYQCDSTLLREVSLAGGPAQP